MQHCCIVASLVRSAQYIFNMCIEILQTWTEKPSWVWSAANLRFADKNEFPFVILQSKPLFPFPRNLPFLIESVEEVIVQEIYCFAGGNYKG